jgi:hypothetical protein
MLKAISAYIHLRLGLLLLRMLETRAEGSLPVLFQ